MSYDLLEFDVINQEMMCLDTFLFLIDHWDESDAGSVVVDLFESQMDISLLWRLLHINQISEIHDLSIISQN